MNLQTPRHRSWSLALLLSMLGACTESKPTATDSPSQSQTSAAKNSPAMAQMQRLLEAINSGDRATLQEYAQANLSPNYKDPPGIDMALGLHKEFGGFDVLEASEVRSNQVHGWIHARDSDAIQELALDVEAEAPHKLTFLHIGWGNTPKKFVRPRMTEAAAVEALRAEAARRAAADKFSGAVLVTHGDRALLREAYGLSDRQKEIPNTVDTRFRTASVGKMFTAVAVLRLVQDGKLKLNTRIGEILPDLGNKPVEDATIQQLLAHTAGTGDIFGPRYDQHRQELNTHDDFVKVYGDEKLSFEPGAKCQYSNLGYIYLGAAIEHASGKSYYDYLGEAVFKPAGMTNSDVPPADVSMEGRALGYQRPAGTREWLSAMSQLSYRGDGAGGAFATVDDLGAFVAALRGNRLLDAKHTKLMIEPKVEIWAGKHYGLGATIETYNSSPPSIGHSGGEPGTSTEVWFMPATGYTVIVVSNFDPPTAGQVAAFIRGRLPEKAP